MVLPILQTITPGAAIYGMPVTLTGYHLDGCSVVLLPPGGGEVVVSPTSTADTELVFRVPFGTLLARHGVKARNADGDSDTLSLYITDDPLLGVPVCDGEKSAEDYREQAIQLQPEGRAWSVSADSYWQKLLGAICEEVARMRERACDLRREQRPSLTDELLEDWETELGLPETCPLADTGTDEQRRAEVVRKFRANGGSSIGYFRDLAALVGLDVAIYEELTAEQFLAGSGRAGNRIWGAIWLFTWYVIVQNYEIIEFLAGQGKAGDRLREWRAGNIGCFFDAIKPAHTNLVVRYGELLRRGYGYFPYGYSPYGY